MRLKEEYLKNPCGTLSIPYWKNKGIQIPQDMKIVHHRDFTKGSYLEYLDEPYFRLYHSLKEVEVVTLNNFYLRTATQDDIPFIVDVINQSYSDISVTYEQLIEYTKVDVYHSNLWVVVIDKWNDTIIGCGIADLDKELHEGILEWIQVVPEYRGKKIGQLMVNELLKRLSGVADFATVSGKVNNLTRPELLYRKCGFTGNDIWHILTK